MTFQDELNNVQSSTQQGNIMNSFIKYYIDNELNNLKELVLGGAPETLDTLKELADAIASDPTFFSSMSTANTALQTALDAVQADVNQNETDADAAIAAETSARTAAVTGEATSRQTAIDAVNALITTLQTEAASRNTRITALEADPTTATAVAAVQSDVDQNESDCDAATASLSGRLDVLEVDPTTQALLTAEIARATSVEGGIATDIINLQADVDANETASDAAETALSGRLDVLEADPTTKTYVDAQVSGIVDAAPGALNTLNELAAALGDDANYTTTVTNLVAAVQTDVDQNESDADTAIAAVQADVDQNEADGDAADAALSARITTLEADPTTATAVAAVQADVDSIEAAASTARTNLQTALQNAIDAVQADVNTNESDSDTAIAGKLGLAGGTLTGNLVVSRDFPDLQLKSNGEKRLMFTDAGGAATFAIKNTSGTADFYVGGVANGNKELSISSTGVTVTNTLSAADLDIGSGAVTFAEGSGVIVSTAGYTTSGIITVNGAASLTGTTAINGTTLSINNLGDFANDSAAASGGVAVNQVYRNGSVLMVRVA